MNNPKVAGQEMTTLQNRLELSDGEVEIVKKIRALVMVDVCMMPCLRHVLFPNRKSNDFDKNPDPMTNTSMVQGNVYIISPDELLVLNRYRNDPLIGEFVRNIEGYFNAWSKDHLYMRSRGVPNSRIASIGNYVSEALGHELDPEDIYFLRTVRGPVPLQGKINILSDSRMCDADLDIIFRGDRGLIGEIARWFRIKILHQIDQISTESDMEKMKFALLHAWLPAVDAALLDSANEYDMKIKKGVEMVGKIYELQRDNQSGLSERKKIALRKVKDDINQFQDVLKKIDNLKTFIQVAIITLDALIGTMRQIEQQNVHLAAVERLDKAMGFDVIEGAVGSLTQNISAITGISPARFGEIVDLECKRDEQKERLMDSLGKLYEGLLSF